MFTKFEDIKPIRISFKLSPNERTEILRSIGCCKTAVYLYSLEGAARNKLNMGVHTHNVVEFSLYGGAHIPTAFSKEDHQDSDKYIEIQTHICQVPLSYIWNGSSSEKSFANNICLKNMGSYTADIIRTAQYYKNYLPKAPQIPSHMCTYCVHQQDSIHSLVTIEEISSRINNGYNLFIEDLKTIQKAMIDSIGTKPILVKDKRLYFARGLTEKFEAVLEWFQLIDPNIYIRPGLLSTCNCRYLGDGVVSKSRHAYPITDKLYLFPKTTNNNCVQGILMCEKHTNLYKRMMRKMNNAL